MRCLLLAVLAFPTSALADTFPSQPIAAGAAPPAGVSITGAITDGRRFTDKNGDNLLLVTTRDGKRARELHVYHLARRGGPSYALLRELKDFVEDCEVDATLALVPGSITVTDLDGDGLAEAGLAYAISCKGDVSPDGMKLMLLENGDKYAMRGTQRLMKKDRGRLVPLYPNMEAEPPVADAALKKQKVFYAFAQRRWKALEQIVVPLD